MAATDTVMLKLFHISYNTDNRSNLPLQKYIRENFN